MPMPKGHVVSPVEDRFDAKTDKSGDCWLWTGFVDKAGYGRLRVGGRSGESEYAHKISYERFVGSVPAGLEIDHTCRVRHCVNPAHLEAVTHRENVLRGAAPNIALHLAGRCQRGHPADRSYRRKGTNHVVYCRDCRAENRKR